MTAGAWWRSAGGAAGLLATLSALGAAGTGAVLFDRYRPAAPGSDPGDLPAAVRTSMTWGHLHGAALVGTLALAVLVLFIALGRAGTDRSVRALVGVATALVGVASAAVALLTRPLVDFDQVGLREVTVGTDRHGWRLGLADDVRFLLVHGSEVSPSTYTWVLIGHLAAPALAAVAFVGAGTALGGRTPGRSAGPRG